MHARYEVEFVVVVSPDATMSVAEDVMKILDSSLLLDDFFVYPMADKSGEIKNLVLRCLGVMFFESTANNGKSKETIESEIVSIAQKIYENMPQCTKVLANISNPDEQYTSYDLDERDYSFIKNGSDLKDDEYRQQSSYYDVLLYLSVPKDFTLESLAAVNSLIESECTLECARLEEVSTPLHKMTTLSYHGFVNLNKPVTPPELVSQLSRKIWDKLGLYVPLQWSVLPLDVYESRVVVFMSNDESCKTIQVHSDSNINKHSQSRSSKSRKKPSKKGARK